MPATTLPAGTPLWKPPFIPGATSANPNTELRVCHPEETDASCTVFAGVTCREGEPTTDKIPVVTKGQAYARVKGPVDVLGSVGFSAGHTYLVADGAPACGRAMKSITDGSTVLIPVELGLHGNSVERPLYVRFIGIDAMWVSRSIDNDAYSTRSYWYSNDPNDADESEHFFCLKPLQLQNRSWWNEVTGQGIWNEEFGITDGVSPQAGALTVSSVETQSVDSFYGVFQQVVARLLRYSNTTPPTIYRQDIWPPYKGAFSSLEQDYGSNSIIQAYRIPKGYVVCNEHGKVVWDAWTSHSIGSKPTTNPRVLTVPLDTGASSPVIPGLYDVEMIDLNLDGRHWRDIGLTTEEQLMAATALRYAHLDDTKTFVLKVVSGVPQWVEEP